MFIPDFEPNEAADAEERRAVSSCLAVLAIVAATFVVDAVLVLIFG